MKVFLDFDNHSCKVVKEKYEKPIPLSGWIRKYGGDPSSTLLYKIKKELNKKGWNIIKKRMNKDGYLTSEERQYLVTREKNGNNFCIYDGLYDIRDAREEYNKLGEIILNLDCENGFEYKEMNPYSKNTKELLEQHPEFFNETLKFMETKIKALKSLKKEKE